MKNPKDILRWNVRERHIDMSVIDFPVTTFPLSIIDPKAEKVSKGDRGLAVVRTDTHQIITRGSSDYELVKHTELASAVEAMFDANGVKYELYDIHTGGTKGNHMYVNYIVKGQQFKVDGDKYMPFVQLQNSYDRFIAFCVVTGLYRMACWNGNLWGTKEMQFMRKKHVCQNIDLRNVAIHLDTWINNLGIASKQLGVLAKEKLSDTMVEDVLKAMFTAKKDHELFKQSQLLPQYVKDMGNTRYALFNALTAYATHVMSDATVYSRQNYVKARQVQIRATELFGLTKGMQLSKN